MLFSTTWDGALVRFSPLSLFVNSYPVHKKQKIIAVPDVHFRRIFDKRANIVFYGVSKNISTKVVKFQ
jgi:hypothetical protein